MGESKRTQEEKNWVIAEWLGKKFYGARGQEIEPNFYQDEAASALILEKMPQGMVWSYFMDGQKRWGCECDLNHTGRNWHADRKTAIAEAALLLIHKELRVTSK